MVQQDPHPTRRASDRGRTAPILRSLQDRILFRQAQGILVGLTGCGHADAARSLRTAAAELDLEVAAVAERFLGALTGSGAGPARTLLLRIAVLALLPDGSARGVEADAAPAPSVHAGPGPGAVAGVLSSSDGGGTVLDLSGLTHLDGAGLHALEALAIRARDGGSPLRVTLPRSPELRRLLRFAVTMRWLPAAFQTTDPPAPVRGAEHPSGDRPGVGAHGATPASGRAAHLAELHALYDRHASACLSLARRLTGDDGDAEDAVQAAFLDTWQMLTSGAPLPGQSGAQLLRRTHREAVRRLREARTRPRPAPAASGVAPPGAPDRRHLPRRSPPDSRAELATLPEHQARPLRLAFWNGLSIQEIAAATGAPLSDVRADLLAGVRALTRARLGPPDRGGPPPSAG